MMLTRCPNCATAFRVSAMQLKVKQGRVRCGQCRQVFNALDTLVEESQPAPAASESAPPAEAPPQPAQVAAVEPPSEGEHGASDELALVSHEPISGPVNDPASNPVGGIASGLASEPASDLASDLASEVPEQRPWPGHVADDYAAPVFGRTGRGHPWLWGSAAFLALLLLSLQVLLHFRTELSLSIPEAKPLLRDGSALLGLDLPLPHKPDLLGIETSDLHPGTGARLVLAATLKNQAAFSQAYPHLEFTLTDIGDQALLRKVLAPGDYLPPGVDVGAGFAANGELAFNLDLEASVAGAAGYRIYLFYP